MFKAIIFDLDGTLLNTLSDLADSVNELLSNYNFPIHPVNAYKYLVGDGAKTLIQRVLPPDKVKNKKQLEKLLKEYKHIYRSRMILKTKPYDGIIDLLTELNKLSFPISVLSNKSHLETVLLIKKMFKDIKFEIVMGAIHEISKKPNPSNALFIADKLKIKPDLFIYVGDTAVDMITAKNAGMFGVGVTWGFRQREELEENGAKIIIDKPEEIFKIIK